MTDQNTINQDSFASGFWVGFGVLGLVILIILLSTAAVKQYTRDEVNKATWQLESQLTRKNSELLRCKRDNVDHLINHMEVK